MGVGRLWVFPVRDVPMIVCHVSVSPRRVRVFFIAIEAFVGRCTSA